jgi:hypothetical protein
MQAKGISEKLAAKQAKKNAQRLVSTAEVIKREATRSLAATAAPPSAKQTSGVRDTLPAPALSQSTIAMSMLTSGASGESQKDDLEAMPGYVRQGYFRRRYGTPMQMLTGAMLRLGVALVLLTIYANWWNVNHAQSLLSAANEVVTTRQEDKVELAARKDISTGTVINAVEAVKQADDKPLSIMFVPDSLTEPIIPSSLLVAGLLLLLGAAFRGTVLGLAMYLSAFIAMFGYRFELPMIYQSVPVAAIVATGVWLFSIIFLRTRTD